MKWTDFVVPEDLERMKSYHRSRRIDQLAAPRNMNSDTYEEMVKSEKCRIR